MLNLRGRDFPALRAAVGRGTEIVAAFCALPHSKASETPKLTILEDEKAQSAQGDNVHRNEKKDWRCAIWKLMR
jgi:hypothetical protein